MLEKNFSEKSLFLPNMKDYFLILWESSEEKKNLHPFTFSRVTLIATYYSLCQLSTEAGTSASSKTQNNALGTSTKINHDTMSFWRSLTEEIDQWYLFLTLIELNKESSCINHLQHFIVLFAFLHAFHQLLNFGSCFVQPEANRQVR